MSLSFFTFSKSGNIAAFRPYKHFIVLETEFVDSRGGHRVTVDINIIATNAIKADIISAHNKSVVALYVRNRRQQRSGVRITLQNPQTFCDPAYRCQSCGGIQ